MVGCAVEIIDFDRIDNVEFISIKVILLKVICVWIYRCKNEFDYKFVCENQFWRQNQIYLTGTKHVRINSKHPESILVTLEGEPNIHQFIRE